MSTLMCLALMIGLAGFTGTSATNHVAVRVQPLMAEKTVRTYYVSVSGSNSNAGTQTAPFRTIQKAADIVAPGDTVIVKDGTYTGPSNPFCKNSDKVAVVCLSRGGTAELPITFKSENKWGAVIDGENSYAVGFTINGGEQRIGNVVIENFDIRNLVDPGKAGGAAGIELYESGHHSIISGNNIHDIGRINTATCNGQVGIYLNVDNVTIEKNVIHDIGRISPAGAGCGSVAALDATHDHGIYLSAGDNTIVRNNVMYGITRGWGIQIYPHRQSNVQVLNNTFAGPGNTSQPGQIVIWGSGDICSNCMICNNVFSAGRGGFIHTKSSVNAPGTSICNNLSSSASVFDVTPGGSPRLSGNLLNKDPAFVGLLDFHLSNTSPAIDAGVPVGVISDFDGRPRPQGAAFDIGAFEFSVRTRTSSTK